MDKCEVTDTTSPRGCAPSVSSRRDTRPEAHREWPCQSPERQSSDVADRQPEQRPRADREHGLEWYADK
jgi:hypothetical protein